MAFDWMNPFNLEEQRRLQLGYLLAGMSQGLGAMSGPQTGGLGAGMMYKPSVAQTLASGLTGGIGGLGAYNQYQQDALKQQMEYAKYAQDLAAFERQQKQWGMQDKFQNMILQGMQGGGQTTRLPAAQQRAAMGVTPGGAPAAPVGAPPMYRDLLSGFESSGGADTVNENNLDVKGPYQISSKFHPDLAGLQPDEALTRLLEQQERDWQGYGSSGAPFNRAPTDWEQYGMHRLGPAGFKKLLTAPPDTPLERLYPDSSYKDWIKDNPDMRGKTAGEFRSMLKNRFGTGMTWQEPWQNAGAQPGATPQAQPQQAVAQPQASSDNFFEKSSPGEAAKWNMAWQMAGYEGSPFTVSKRETIEQIPGVGWVTRDASGDYTHLAGEQKTIGGVAPEVYTAATQLRDSFENLQPVKNYLEIIPIIDNAYASYGDNTPAADLNLIYAVAKTFDPQGVVRDADVKTVRENQSIPEVVKGYWTRILGGGGLTPEARTQLLEQLQHRSDALANEYGQIYDDYARMYQRLHLPADEFLGRKHAQGVREAKNGAIIVDGVKYYPTGKTIGGKQVYVDSKGEEFVPEGQ